MLVDQVQSIRTLSHQVGRAYLTYETQEWHFIERRWLCDDCWRLDTFWFAPITRLQISMCQVPGWVNRPRLGLLTSP